MQTVSNLYKEILAGEHEAEIKLDVAGVEYGPDKVISVNSNQKIYEITPGIGNAVASQLDVSFYVNTAAASYDIPPMAEVIPYVRIKNATLTSEWLRKGTYYIDTRSLEKCKDSTFIFSAHLFDPMLKAENELPQTVIDNLTWPADDIDVVEAIADEMGVDVDDRTVALMGSGYQIDTPTGYSMKETLGGIAALYGGNFIITDLGKLRLLVINDYPHPDPELLADENDDYIAFGNFLILVTQEPEGYDQNGTNIKRNARQLSIAPKFDPVTRVELYAEEDVKFTAGTDTGKTLDGVSPWATQAACDAILQTVSGWEYQPLTATDAIIDPAVELGDGVLADGYFSVIAQLFVTYGKHITAEICAPFDEELNSEYRYVSPTQREINRLDGRTRVRLEVLSDSIQAEVVRATAAEGTLSSQIRITADGIVSTVAASQEKYDETGYTIDLYGYGEPDPPSGTIMHDGLTWLDQSTGTLYTFWVNPRNPTQHSWTHYPTVQLDKITEELSSSITQNANRIALVVNSSDNTINAASIVSAINSAGSSVVISADHVSLSGKTINLTGDNITISSTGFSVSAAGAVTASDLTITGGAITLGSNFSVDSQGNLTANSATLTGTLTIGGSTITAANLRYGAINGNAYYNATQSSSYAPNYLYVGTLSCTLLSASSAVTTPSINLNGDTLVKRYLGYKDASGATQYASFVCYA